MNDANETPAEDTAEPRIEHRPDAEPRPRFALLDGADEVGELDYVWDAPTVMNLMHTGVRGAYGGRGLARALVMAAVDHARTHGLTIVPTCSYARKVLTKDESYADVLAG